jgi:CRP/FNR family transcriptional regulator, cyclic AMP receptor protein
MTRRYRAFLQQNGWLSRTDPEFANALLDKAGRLFAAKGDTVWQAGDEAGGLFALVEGDVSFYTSAGTSGAPLVHIFGPGFWTGEGTIITGDPKRASVVARGAMTALLIPRYEVLRLLKDRPEWWREIGLLALQLQQLAAGAAADLLLPTSELRCAGVLLRIAGLRHNDAHGRSIIQLSHEELAQMSGISRQTAARSIAALEEKGLIRLGYGTIEMLAPAQLRQMVEDA